MEQTLSNEQVGECIVSIVNVFMDHLETPLFFFEKEEEHGFTLRVRSYEEPHLTFSFLFDEEGLTLSTEEYVGSCPAIALMGHVVYGLPGFIPIAFH